MVFGAAYVHLYLTVLLRRQVALITFRGPSRQSRTKNALAPDVHDDFRSKIVSNFQVLSGDKHLTSSRALPSRKEKRRRLSV